MCSLALFYLLCVRMCVCEGALRWPCGAGGSTWATHTRVFPGSCGDLGKLRPGPARCSLGIYHSVVLV